MKIIKLKTTPIQTSGNGMLDNYYKVPDSYVISSNEDDVTSVTTLFVFSQSGKFDYGIFRDSIQNNLVPNWANLLFEDRRKCVQHYKYPANLDPGEWGTYFSDADHQKNWNLLTANIRETRRQRLFASFNKISYRLTTMQVATIYMTTKQLLVDYYYANLPHILYWVQNGTYAPMGLNYTTNGFAQMSGYTTSLRDEILDILINGNYENAEKQIII
jgi:hypothetical protein